MKTPKKSPGRSPAARAPTRDAARGAGRTGAVRAAPVRDAVRPPRPSSGYAGRARDGGVRQDGRAAGPRTRSFDAAERRPPRTVAGGERKARGDTDSRFGRSTTREVTADPYRPARRPAWSETAARTASPSRSSRGFTVTLDADVARVFRGDASVNKALRLVMQLTQVVQGPPATGAARPRGDYANAPRFGGRPSPAVAPSAATEGFVFDADVDSPDDADDDVS